MKFSTALVLITTLSSAFVLQTKAFCVYNEMTDGTEVSAYQEEEDAAGAAKRFKMNINPGTSACCNWKNTDCCISAQRDDNIKMEITVNGVTKVNFMECGGSLQVTGTKDNVGYIVQNPSS